ncbi:hypothetical protein JXA80_07970 [bacterium]|nr:hypothetical protein [candidate division CSSED10-310 bacterium]
MKHRFHRIFLLFCLIPATPVWASMHTEMFTDFSGFDPFQSTAVWNRFDHRLELHRIESDGFHGVRALCPDATGGWYCLWVSIDDDNLSLSIQHFTAEGTPSWPGTGVRVSANSASWDADAACLSGGDCLVCWTSTDDPSAIYAQRFTVTGTPVWSNPIRVNQTPSGAVSSSVQLATLPGNEAVIAFSDNRASSRKTYLQRISGTGSRIWPTDRPAWPSSSATELNARIATDDSGNIFAAWNSQAGTYDVFFTRIASDGTVFWDPPRVANLDTAFDQTDFGMTLVDNEAVIFSWVDSDGTTFRLDTQRWEYSGVCLQTGDRTQLVNTNGILLSNVHTLINGNILISYVFSYEDMYHLGCHVIDADLDPFGPPQLIYSENPFEMLNGYTVKTSPVGGACVALDWVTEYTAVSALQRLGNLGQPLWDTCIPIRRFPGTLSYTSHAFSRHSGGDGGFRMAWIDHREGHHHCQGCPFATPVQPASFIRRFDSLQDAMRVKTVQALDGSIVASWAGRSGDANQLEIMWLDAHWKPLWDLPVAITEYEPFGGIPEWDLDIDSSGRAMVIWRDTDESFSHILIQGITRNRQFVYPAPIQVNSGSTDNDFSPQLLAVNTGDLIAAWLNMMPGDPSLCLQRILSTGNLAWSDMVQITGSFDSIQSFDITRQNDTTAVVFSARSGSDAFMYHTGISDAGTIASGTIPISNPYPACYETVAVSIGSDIYVAWISRSDSLETEEIRMQKLSSGTPVWFDPCLTTLVFDYVTGLDMIQNDTNRLALVFTGEQGVSRHFLIQEIDTNGTRSYSTEQLLFNPAPKYYFVEYAVSSQVNSEDPVYWAAVAGVESLQGGSTAYWLSNTGGATWQPTVPGLPVVFPETGTDLRWAVDLYADMNLQNTPYVTSIITAWNETPIATDIVLNQSHYYGGDRFLLTVRHSNSSSPIHVDRYILLDVYGMYWFWPSWSDAPDSSAVTISSGYSESPVFDFTWPSGVGTAEGLRFWAALLDPTSIQLVGPWDYVTFGYGP